MAMEDDGDYIDGNSQPDDDAATSTRTTIDVSFIIDTSRSLNHDELQCVRDALHIFREDELVAENDTNIALLRVSTWRGKDKTGAYCDDESLSRPSVATKRSSGQADSAPILQSEPGDIKRAVSSVRTRSMYYNSKADVTSLRNACWEHQLESRNRKVSLKAKKEKFYLAGGQGRKQSGLPLNGKTLIDALKELTRIEYRKNSIRICILVLGKRKKISFDLCPSTCCCSR